MAEADMTIVDMKRTKAEQKVQEEKYKTMPMDSPDYPWGLCINLGQDERRSSA